MPTVEVTSPSGQTLEIDIPDGAPPPSESDLDGMFKAASTATPKPKPAPALIPPGSLTPTGLQRNLIINTLTQEGAPSALRDQLGTLFGGMDTAEGSVADYQQAHPPPAGAIGTQMIKGIDGKMYPADVLPGGALRYRVDNGQKDPFAIPGSPITSAENAGAYDRIYDPSTNSTKIVPLATKKPSYFGPAQTGGKPIPTYPGITGPMPTFEDKFDTFRKETVPSFLHDQGEAIRIGITGNGKPIFSNEDNYAYRYRPPINGVPQAPLPPPLTGNKFEDIVNNIPADIGLTVEGLPGFALSSAEAAGAGIAALDPNSRKNAMPEVQSYTHDLSEAASGGKGGWYNKAKSGDIAGAATDLEKGAMLHPVQTVLLIAGLGHGGLKAADIAQKVMMKRADVLDARAASATDPAQIRTNAEQADLYREQAGKLRAFVQKVTFSTPEEVEGDRTTPPPTVAPVVAPGEAPSLEPVTQVAGKDVSGIPKPLEEEPPLTIARTPSGKVRAASIKAPAQTPEPQLVGAELKQPGVAEETSVTEPATPAASEPIAPADLAKIAEIQKTLTPAQEQAETSPATPQSAPATLPDVSHVVDAASLSNALQAHFKYTPEQAQATAAIADARAQAWSNATGRPSTQWYQSRIAGIGTGDVTQAPAGARGSVDFLDDNSALINALSNPDSSTGIHELAHVFRRDMLREGGLSPEDIAAVERDLGVKDGNWTTEHEEDFSRGFERYAADGTAPTPALARVFEQFKQWLLGIYRATKGPAEQFGGTPIQTPVSPELRNAFEKLLGKTDEGPQISAKPVEAPKAPASTYAGSINERLFAGDPAALEEVRATAERLGMNDRDTVTDAQTRELGRSLNLSYDDVRKMRPGVFPAPPEGLRPAVWYKSYVDAIRNLHAKAQAELVDAKNEAREAQETHEFDPTPENLKAVTRSDLARAKAQETAEAMFKHANEAANVSGVVLQGHNRPTEAYKGVGYQETLAEAPRLSEALPTDIPAPKGEGPQKPNVPRPARKGSVTPEQLASAVDAYKGGQKLFQSDAPEGSRLYQKEETPLSVIGRYHYEQGTRSYPKWKTAVEATIGEKIPDIPAKNAWYQARDIQKKNVVNKQIETLDPIFKDNLKELGRKGAAKFLRDIPDETRDKILGGAPASAFTPEEKATIAQHWDANTAEPRKTGSKASQNVVKQIVNEVKSPAIKAARSARMKALNAAKKGTGTAQASTTDPVTKTLKATLGKNFDAFGKELESASPGLMERLKAGTATPEELSDAGKLVAKHTPTRTVNAITDAQAKLKSAVKDARKEIKQANTPEPHPFDALVSRRVVGGMKTATAIRTVLEGTDMGKSAVQKLMAGEDLTPAEGRLLARTIDAQKKVVAKSNPDEVTARLTKLMRDARTGRLGYDDPFEAAKTQLINDANRPVEKMGPNADPERKSAAEAKRDAKVKAISEDLAKIDPSDTQAIGRVMMKHSSLLDQFKQYVLGNILSGWDTGEKIAVSHPATVSMEEMRRWLYGDRSEVAGGLKAGAAALKNQGIPEAKAILKKGSTAAYLEGQSYFKPTDGRIPVESRLAAHRAVLRAHSAFYQLMQTYNTERGLHLYATEDGKAKGLTGKALEDHVQDVLLHPEKYKPLAEKAIRFGMEETQTQPNPVSKAISSAANKHPASRFAKDVLLPVANLPLNAMKFALDAQTGLLSSRVQARLYAHWNPEASAADIKAYQDKVFHRGAIGAGIAAASGIANLLGGVTQPDPKHGRYVGRINVFGKSMDVPAGPMGVMMDTGADIAHGLKTRNMSDLPQALMSPYVQENPVIRSADTLTGLASAITGKQRDENTQNRALGGLATEMMPLSGLTGNIASLEDRLRGGGTRDKGKGEFPLGALDYPINALPYARTHFLPPSMDKATGKPYPQAILHTQDALTEDQLRREDYENERAKETDARRFLKHRAKAGR